MTEPESILTMLDVAGVSLVVVGVMLFSIPAGLIVAGIGVLLISWAVSR